MATPPAGTREPVPSLDSHGAAATPRWAIILLVGVAVAVYLNSLGNGLVYDDAKVVVRNPDIRALGNIADMFRHDVNGLPKGHPEHCGSYRPLATLTYALNYWVGGLSPAGYHVVNVALHAICSVLAFVVARAILGEWRLGLVAALLFAAHPVHTDAVNSVTNRSEVLGGVFFFAAFACSLRHRTGHGLGWLATSWLLYLAGILSKESVILLPGALLALDLLMPPESASSHGQRPWGCVRFWLPYVGYAAVASVTLAVRSLAVGELLRVPFTAVDNPMAFAPPLASWLTRLFVLILYARLLVWPVSLSADYSFHQIPLVESLGDPRNLKTLVLAAAFVMALVWSYRKSRVVCFSLVFGAVTFLIGSNLIIPIGTTIGERLLYVPSFGFCMALAWVVREVVGREPKAARYAFAGAGLLVALYGVCTVARNPDWSTTLSLMRSAARVCPESVKVHHNLGYLMEEEESFGAAEASYRRALGIRPGYVPSLTGLGRACAKQGRLDEAASIYDKLAMDDPKNPSVPFELGEIMRECKEWDRAAEAYRETVEVDPRHRRAWLNLGYCLEKLDRPDEARHAYREGADRVPGDLDIEYNLIRLLLSSSQFDDVESRLPRLPDSAHKQPRFLRLRYNLGVEYLRRENYAGVVRHFDFILQQDPEFPKKTPGAGGMKRDVEKWRKRLP